MAGVLCPTPFSPVRSMQSNKNAPTSPSITAQQQAKLLQQIRGLLQKNELGKAQALCQQFNSQCPENADAWVAASVVAGRLRNPQKALACVDKALSLQPNSARFMVAKANLLVDCHRLTEAHTLAQQAEASSRADAQGLDMAGTIFSRCDDQLAARRCYLSATKLQPNNSYYQFNLAAALRYLGDMEGAERVWSKVIELQPLDYDAWHMRSDLRTQTAEHNHVAELQTLLDQGFDSWQARMKILFALAKEHEDLGDYEASFSLLQQGASLRRRHMAYKVDRDIETIDKIIDVYSASAEQNDAGNDCDQAIFIVGLPRTGTTLVDRILSSHSKVVSAGELNNFALQMTAQVQRNVAAKMQGNKSLDRMGLIEQSAKLDWQALGRAYLSSTESYQQGSSHITDKMPLNFLYLGLIHRALPKAKIIHVVRNPMDTCYAMYKRLFKDAYPMSYDFDDLGRYYLAYRRLMHHWYKTLPGVIHTVAYEELLAHQEQVSRQLIDACDIDWEDNCLQFESNKSATTTASASQVRQGLYRSSIGKWHCYEAQLLPLRELLERGGVDTEHDAY